jgi:hypothetical protein
VEELVLRLPVNKWRVWAGGNGASRLQSEIRGVIENDEADAKYIPRIEFNPKPQSRTTQARSGSSVYIYYK